MISMLDIEFGVGYGLTNPGSDRWMTKLMITTNLFDAPKEENGKAVSCFWAQPNGLLDPCCSSNRAFFASFALFAVKSF